jgi:transposase
VRYFSASAVPNSGPSLGRSRDSRIVPPAGPKAGRSQVGRRRSFTPEFKGEIVELCQSGDRSVGQVAKDFELTETAVREWVRQAERDSGDREDGGLTSTEREELAQLRQKTGGCGRTWRSSSGPWLSSR